ncbi:alpha/beta hydrolase family protein [Pontimicrobium sp. IMCC45349]|uniref:alpha/beta hydrolase family protein n=1 Tax=Pontimicrobium sp. IMCC45349 TaxID=3391574 RepID=UPI0039A28291
MNFSKTVILLFFIIAIYSCSSNDDSNNNSGTPEPTTIQVGHTVVNFNDANRDRTIETHIYYPAQNSGTDVEVLTGEYPVLVFGHGFLMEWNAYQSLWETLVGEGYIVCFPNTETGFTPSHQDFALDLNQVAIQMQSENDNTNSIFNNRIIAKTAMLGHSMGGGSALLAAQNNTEIDAVITLAAAETNPSAIAASIQIEVPVLMLLGENDCVAPAAEHQLPMYENLNSNCKVYAEIAEGTHCNFADANSNCDLGEIFCASETSITKDAQIETTLNLMKSWLSYTLKDNVEAFTELESQLQDASISTQIVVCD